MNKETSSSNHSYFYTELKDLSFSYPAIPVCDSRSFAGALNLLIAQISIKHITNNSRGGNSVTSPVNA